MPKEPILMSIWNSVAVKRSNEEESACVTSECDGGKGEGMNGFVPVMQCPSTKPMVWKGKPIAKVLRCADDPFKGRRESVSCRSICPHQRGRGSKLPNRSYCSS